MAQPFALLFNNPGFKVKKNNLLHLFRRQIKPKWHTGKIVREELKLGALKNGNSHARDIAL